jgi:hypothetical protein
MQSDFFSVNIEVMFIWNFGKKYGYSVERILSCRITVIKFADAVHRKLERGGGYIPPL